MKRCGGGCPVSSTLLQVAQMECQGVTTAHSLRPNFGKESESLALYKLGFGLAFAAVYRSVALFSVQTRMELSTSKMGDAACYSIDENSTETGRSDEYHTAFVLVAFLCDFTPLHICR